MFSILIVLWQPHQSFPAIGSIRVTGVAAVPTLMVWWSAVFQPPSEKRAKTIVFLFTDWKKTTGVWNIIQKFACE